MTRSLASVALTGVVLFILLGAGQWLAPEAGAWAVGMTTTLVFLVAWPLLMSMVETALPRFAATRMSQRPVRLATWFMLLGGLMSVLGATSTETFLTLAGASLVVPAGVLLAVAMMKATPKTSLVTADDPLTKGDDACMKHIVFSARFLAIAVLLLWGGALAAVWSPLWEYRLHMAGLHVFAIGHLLLLVYGLGHLWIPRFSGVPATAAGAIKGELHTTLLGLTGLTLGLLVGNRGLMSGLGFFVFVGTFTYMGVLGANMMKRKSQTHRVTPEFVYIPWTFTGIFWLISAVLMGLFLNAVPDTFADRISALRSTHMAAALLGGVLQLWLGWQTRITPETPHFAGALRGSFFAFNAGLTLWIWGQFGQETVAAAGLALLVLALGLYVPFLAKLMAPKPMEAA